MIAIGLFLAAAYAAEIADPRSVPSPVPSVEGSLDCGARVNWLKAGVDKGATVKDTLIDAIGDANVIAFGESHVHVAGVAEYPELLGQIKKAKPDLNCLFIEGKSVGQSALDAYQFSANDDYEPIRALNKAVPDRTPLAQATPELMKFAKTNGIKVYAVDTHDARNDVRNAFMADQISSRMKNGCKGAAFLVGKTHIDERLVPTHPKSITPVPDRLRKSGLRVATLNLMSHGDLKDSLRDCSPRIEIPGKDFAIRVKGAAPAIEPPIMDVFKPASWSDYDGILVIR